MFLFIVTTFRRLPLPMCCDSLLIFIFFSQVMHNNWLFMNEARIYSAPTTSTAATFYVIHLAVGCVKSKALQRRRRESHRESP